MLEEAENSAKLGYKPDRLWCYSDIQILGRASQRTLSPTYIHMFVLVSTHRPDVVHTIAHSRTRRRDKISQTQWHRLR